MLAAAGRAAEAFALVDAAAADAPADPRLALGRAVARDRSRPPRRGRRARPRRGQPRSPRPARRAREPATGRRRAPLPRSVPRRRRPGPRRTSPSGRPGPSTRTRTSRRLLERAAPPTPGPRELDRDGDGWWEERWEIVAGVPARWMRDADQDGVAEFDAALEAGQPRSLSYHPSSRYGLRRSPTGCIRGSTASRSRDLGRAGLDAREPHPRGAVPRPARSPGPDAAEVLRAAVRLDESAGAAGGAGASR